MPDNNWYWLLYIAAALLLPRLPVVGKFFNIINTTLHEFGHALVALCTGGHVNKIQLFQDTSGTTTTQSSNKLSAFFVSLAGYPFAASVAWLSFYLILNDAAMGLILGLSMLFFVMLLFWIRNWYGVIWVLLFCGLNGFLIYWGEPKYLEIAALFYSTMIMVESVSSALVLFVLSVRKPSSAGDATNLTKITGIPAFLWSLLFLAYTFWVLYRVINMLI